MFYSSVILKFDYDNTNSEVFDIGIIEKVNKFDEKYIYKYI